MDKRLLHIFNTMGFNNGIVKEARLMKENSIYIVMWDAPDLIFEFNSMDDWSLCTAKNYIQRKDDDKK